MLQTLKHKLNTMSNAHRRIAEYILENNSEAAFLTALQIAKRAMTSEATVVRFATSLGYKGFPDMRSALQSELRGQFSAISRLQSKEEQESDNLIESVLRRDLEKSLATLSQIDDRPIRMLSKSICKAPAVYIVAMRNSASLALYLESYLSWFIPSVFRLSPDRAIETFASAPEGSLVIGIGFPRYSRQTPKLLLYSRSFGFQTVAITDSHDSPLAANADLVVTVPCSHIAFIDSLTLPLTLLNALLLDVTEELGPIAQERLDQLEKLWHTNKIYVE